MPPLHPWLPLQGYHIRTQGKCMQTRAMIGREGRAPGRGGGGARRGIGKFLERISSITTNVMPQCSLYQSPHPSLDLVRLYLLLNGPWGDAVDALQTRNRTAIGRFVSQKSKSSGQEWEQDCSSCNLRHTFVVAQLLHQCHP